MKNLIIDFQTFGFDARTCPAISCSLFVFDWKRFGDKPYSFQEIVDGSKSFKLSVQEQVGKYGYILEQESIDWWGERLPSIKKSIKPSITDLSVEDFVQNLLEYTDSAPKFVYWWTRNNTFDPIVLYGLGYNAKRDAEMKNAFKPWRVRDMGTHIDAKFNFSSDTNFIPVEDSEYWAETYVQYNSSHDIAADVLRLQAIFRAENDLEMVKR
jgi:hypothetical protein